MERVSCNKLFLNVLMICSFHLMERASCKKLRLNVFIGALCMMLYTPKDAELKHIDIREVLAQAVHYIQTYSDI